MSYKLLLSMIVLLAGCGIRDREEENRRRRDAIRQRECALLLSISKTAVDTLAVMRGEVGSSWSGRGTCAYWFSTDTIKRASR